MATTGRDYYELLGVSRESSDVEIKRAFRRLARELHPDVSDSSDAGERFREVAEAYQVLSNSETRELYDRYGHAGLRGGGFSPGTFDFGSLSDIFSAFFGDDLFGAGAGRRARGADVAAEGEFVRTQTCTTCAGAGRVPETRCAGCEGAGRVVEERTLEVAIPAGIHDGQQIRISGEGHAGSVGGRAGDVYVRVRVRSDPRFVREGDDVFSTVDLTIAQAALGTTLTTETLEGPVELEFAPGTQPGEVRVLRGRGMPVLQGFGRGDHRVLVNVTVPHRLTDEQRRLLEQFEQLSTDETYRADDGFFEKLKSAFR